MKASPVYPGMRWSEGLGEASASGPLCSFFEQGTDGAQVVVRQPFRIGGKAIVCPPDDHLDEAAGQVVGEESAVHVVGRSGRISWEAILCPVDQASPQITREHPGILANDERTHAALSLAQVAEHVFYDRGRIFLPAEVMPALRLSWRKRMVANGIQQQLQKVVLAAEMSVEGASSDIGPVQDILNRD